MKIKIFAIIVLLLVAISSCEVTDTIPEDAITDLNYWKSPADLKLFANRFYTSLSAPNATADGTSDNLVSNTPNTRLFNTATVPTSGGGWASGDWANIRNANYALDHSKTVTGDTSLISQYLGEIRFFRANEYFNKVKTFGDVPWIDKALTTTDTTILFAARDPQKYVIDKIIADLEWAVSRLNTPANVESGRLHKYAGLQMIARVCLYQGTYMKYRNLSGYDTYLQKAISAAQRVMTEGGYSIVKGSAIYMYTGYPLYYKQQFIQEDLTTNSECVMPRIYNTLLYHGISRSMTESATGASKDFIESFLCRDGLPISLSPLYLGDDSAQMEMTNRDPRLRNMIDNKNMPYYLNGVVPISYPVTPVAVSACPTGYMAMKFRDPTPAQNEANHCSYDWYVFRYAEVLLIYAEAKAELGTITQADLDNTINKLRARLDEPGNFTMGKLSLNPPSDPMATVSGNPRYGYAVSPLIYEIRRERRIELAFEGFRWDDIVRWNAGVLIENPKTMLGITVNTDVSNRYKYYNGGTDQFKNRSLLTLTDWDGKTKTLLKVYANTARTWNNKLYLSPLPIDQLTLNSKLVQNPGW
jgi:starch-binding outer membrane protein, SusD/RagB family